MKKRSKILLSLLTALMLILAVPSMTAFAEADTKTEAPAQVMSSSYLTEQGDTFTTTIYIADNANIIDFDMHLVYDTDKLTLVGAEEHEDMKGAVLFTTKTAGEIDINYTRTYANVSSYMPLVNLTFEVSAYIPAGEYDTLVADTTKTFVAHTLVGTELAEVDLTVDFAPLVIYDIGDVDMNGVVDIADVTTLRRYFAKLTDFSEFQLGLADTYYDGVVDIADAICLQRHLANQGVLFGNRENVNFFGLTGELVNLKSVVRGEALSVIPAVPELSGYTNGRWSATPDDYTPIDLSAIGDETNVYAVYDEVLSVQMEYYRSFLSQYVDEFGGFIYSSKTLPVEIPYADDPTYNADVIWSVSNANIFDREGVFNKPTYDTGITVTATIYSRHNGANYEKASAIKFNLVAKGVYSTPTKAEIVDYLKNITGGTVSPDGMSSVSGGSITKDLNLARKVSNKEVNSQTPYEVHIDWEIENDGTLLPISKIIRSTTELTGVNLVATVTFNGMPLEGDGKVYFYDITLSAISEEEIRYYVIDSIANSVAVSLSTGDKLWDNDERYGSTIKWVSGNNDIINIQNNEVSVSDNAVNGASCPIRVQVAYSTDDGTKTFQLEYVVTANTSNKLLQPGVNISESLYYALLEELDVRMLTTDTLKSDKLLYLDLSKYGESFEDGAGNIHPALSDITGIAHCENLRVLNISNLKITAGLSEVAVLSCLEAFIAKNCGIETLSSGGASVLDSMLNLKLVDLSYNNIATLDGIFSDTNVYNKLKEIYLNNNALTDVSLLDRAPLVTMLALSENKLDSADIAVLSKLSAISYLSLAGNDITDLTPLKKLTSLTELRLQKNAITDIEPLSGLTKLTALYLGDNSISTVTKLNSLTNLEVLYLNNNSIKAIDALSSMQKLRVLNISGNSIANAYALASLAPTETYSGLAELYAENNNILSFAFVKNLTGLKKLMLSGNTSTGDEAADMSEYLSGLVNLEVLTLSGKKLNTLEFLNNEDETVKPIVRLDINGCELKSYYIVKETDGLVSEYVDNLELLASLRSTLKYLDVGNNPWLELSDGYTFGSDTPESVEILRNLNRLEVLYADNFEIKDKMSSLMSMMSEIKYLSAENCGIEDTSWLGISAYYKYVDLANNPINYFDYSYVEGSVETLEYLYLDSTAQTATLGSAGASEFSDNRIVAVSFEGFKIDSVDSLPDMNTVEFMNLSNTGLCDLFGSTSGEGYPSSIGRFVTLKELYLGGNDKIFNKSNLELLYDNFAESETNVHLYNDISLVGFDAQREIDYVNALAITDGEWHPTGGNIVVYRNSGTNGLENSLSYAGFDISWWTYDEYIAISDNVMTVTNIALPTENYIAELGGFVDLYGTECTISTTVEFYKEKYQIRFVLDSDANAYSKREAVNHPINVNTDDGRMVYAVTGEDVIIGWPTRGDYDRFLGWYEDADYTVLFNNDLKNNPRDVTLYAKWDVATYYDSIDETPGILAGKRVVIDWRNESNLDLLSHTGRDIVGATGYNNITVTPETEQVVFIGDETKTYSNFYIALREFAESDRLTFNFLSFSFTSDASFAIGSFDGSIPSLDILVQGTSKIASTYGGGHIISLSGADVSVKGQGNLTLEAGTGAVSATTGGNGGNGGVAIIADEVSLDVEGTLTLYGGNGANGTKGANGANGRDADAVIGDAATNGKAGGKGGNGGDGGVAVLCTKINVSDSGTIVLTGGNGGKGGDGGRGGNGGKPFYPWISTKGGAGGAGGTGGDAAVALSGELVAASNNVTLTSGAVLGNGSKGADGSGK